MTLPPPPPQASGLGALQSAPAEPPLDKPYYGAPFGAAFLRFWKKGITFSGRASRSEFWQAYLATQAVFLVLYLVAVIVIAIGAASYSDGMVSFGTALMWIGILYGLATLVPALAAVWRRLHDTDRSGAIYFIGFIPFGSIVLLVLLAGESKLAGARFDAASTGIAAAPWADGRAVPPPPGAPAVPRPPAVAGTPLVPPPPPPPTPPAPPAPAPPVAAPQPIAPPPPAVSVPTAASTSAPPPPPQPQGVILGIPGFSSGPSAPSVTPGPTPPPPPPAQPEAVQDDDLDSTRIAGPADSWTVQLPDGRRLPLGSPLFFGRAPFSAEHPDALLVPVDDPAKSMSKTHASIVQTGGGIEVTDLHSTNGTKVAVQGETAVSLIPGTPHRLATDATVWFGDYAVTVRRGY